MKKKIIIIGAAGRDFHNFNTHYRDNSDYEVVAFTAAQIPDIAGRVYPPELAGIYIRMAFPFTQRKNWKISSKSVMRMSVFSPIAMCHIAT